MQKMWRLVAKTNEEATRGVRSNIADPWEYTPILLNTSRFRAHDADSTQACLAASTRYGTFSPDTAEESGRDS